MAKRKHHDYKIRTYRTNLNPERELWQIYIGPDDKDGLITTCRSLEEAEHIVRELENDAWYLSRGNTQADRANMQAVPRK
jgi:hypothetical protein